MASTLKNEQPLDMPWKVLLEIRRLLAFPYIRFYFFLHNVPWKEGWRLYGCPIIQRHKKSSIEIGDSLILRSWVQSNPLAPNHPLVLSTRNPGAKLHIGKNVGITGGTICASQQIDIGDHVLIGANCTILDTDFHPLQANKRQTAAHRGQSSPVIIENQVFIGMNSIVLKGVRLGEGSVIGAGSVVTKDVPRGVIAAGNPARVVKDLT